MVSNRISKKKTKKFEKFEKKFEKFGKKFEKFGKKFAAILFAIKNNPRTQILGIVGVDDFRQKWEFSKKWKIFENSQNCGFFPCLKF